MANGSVLSGIRPNNEPVNLVGSFLSGQQARQSILAGQQDLEQGQQLMDIRAQNQQQQVTRAQYDEAVQRARIINRIARQVRDIPSEQQRGEFVQRLDPEMLQSVGIDPAQVQGVGLNDRDLDALIGQTQAVLPDERGSELTAGQRERQDLMRDIEGGIDPATGQLKPENQLTARQRAAATALGLTARAGTATARERIAGDQAITEQVAQSEAEIKDRVTRAEQSAKDAQGQVKEYFTTLGNIQSNIGNYNEAIGLIDEGAGTGVIQSRLPSTRAASQKLDNLKNRLGLDVIGNTTFGALSESELAFAIDTALPTNLEGEELKAWLVEKRSAQEKLASYINNAIQFLNVPGNTLADLAATGPVGGSVQQPGQVQEPQTPQAEAITLPNGIVVRRVQ
jgi:hypothetical protein